jgi:hypothetical protein
MAYPTHPRHQAAREAVEYQQQQQAPQEGGRVEMTPGEQQMLGRDPMLTPTGAEEPPREPAMGDAPPIQEVAPEGPIRTEEAGGDALTEKSSEELQEGRRRLMARLMDEPAGMQFDKFQELLDRIDREMQMRQGG